MVERRDCPDGRGGVTRMVYLSAPLLADQVRVIEAVLGENWFSSTVAVTPLGAAGGSAIVGLS